MFTDPAILFDPAGLSSPTRDLLLTRALELGEYLLTAPPFRADSRMHGAMLIDVRARHRTVVTLAGLYRITGKELYAERAWFFMKDGLEQAPFLMKTPKKLLFDLSTGEAAVTMSFLFDWLGDWMSEEQRTELVEAAKTLILEPYRACVDVEDPKDKIWWHGADMNWNSVCNGGACTLAFQLYEECPEARAVIPLAMQGLDLYMASLPEDGSSEESVGYWAFGNLYLFYALTSWERHHRKPHLFLEGPFFEKGLSFLLDFTPHGAAIGFGDSNKATITGWMLAAAKRVGRQDLLEALSARIQEKPHPDSTVMPKTQEAFPTELFAALLAETSSESVTPRPPLKIYPENGWGIFTQDHLTLTFQAGRTERYHSMRDALAIFVASEGQVLVDSPENHPYPRGWFDQPHLGERGHSRNLYWEDHSTSKSTPCVNGVGQAVRGATIWNSGDTWIESDATALYPWFVDHLSRRVELHPGGFRITDRFETPMEEWHEVRFITSAEVHEDADGWILRRNGMGITLRLEADHPLLFLHETRTRPVVAYGSVTLLRCVLRDPANRSVITTRITSA